jgi:hypothetical protein
MMNFMRTNVYAGRYTPHHDVILWEKWEAEERRATLIMQGYSAKVEHLSTRVHDDGWTFEEYGVRVGCYWLCGGMALRSGGGKATPLRKSKAVFA